MSAVEAATTLLEERGLLDAAALEKKKAEIAEAISRDFAAKGLGVQLQQSDISKYDVVGGPPIDCASRIHLCHAACCKMHFALSGEDLEEGKIRWDVGQPYVIAQGDDGWCVHLDRETKCCGCYAARPLVCRTYDCRNDSRIWLDFERKIINPQVNDSRWPRKMAVEKGASPASEDADVKQPKKSRLMKRALDWLPSHPNVLRFDEYFISCYGLFVGVAFLVAGFAWLSQVSPWIGGWGSLFLPGVVAAAFVGSRLLRVVEAGLDGLLGRERFQLGGHTLYGGILGGAAVVFLALRNTADLWLTLDKAAPAFALGLGIAKLGCFGSGCCVGCPTNGSLFVSYTHRLSKAVASYGLSGVPLAPLQLFESLFALALAGILSALPVEWFGTGRVLGLFLILLSVGRTSLLVFRFRQMSERATLLITGTVHLFSVTLGTTLWVAARSTLSTHGAGRLHMSLLTAASVIAASTLATGLFGLHKDPTLQRTSDQRR
jgi:prolipoprotein diacylglyceryltransferase/Fe-S-cluster containining protein